MQSRQVFLKPVAAQVRRDDRLVGLAVTVTVQLSSSYTGQAVLRLLVQRLTAGRSATRGLSAGESAPEPTLEPTRWAARRRLTSERPEKPRLRAICGLGSRPHAVSCFLLLTPSGLGHGHFLYCWPCSRRGPQERWCGAQSTRRGGRIRCEWCRRAVGDGFWFEAGRRGRGSDAPEPSRVPPSEDAGGNQGVAGSRRWRTACSGHRA